MPDFMVLSKNMLRRYFVFFLLVPSVFSPCTLAAAGSTEAHHEWDFKVTLDGQEFGWHRFTEDQMDGESFKITGDANYNLAIIGIPVFHYRHSVVEYWKNGCLDAMKASTDHNGDQSDVDAEARANGGVVRTSKGEGGAVSSSVSWRGCLMTFAYWNPKMRQQKQLLDPETGEIEAVTFEHRPDKAIKVRGEPVGANVWRVTGVHDPVDILYDDQDNWVGLDAVVRGGRILSYRLE